MMYSGSRRKNTIVQSVWPSLWFGRTGPRPHGTNLGTHVLKVVRSGEQRGVKEKESGG